VRVRTRECPGLKSATRYARRMGDELVMMRLYCETEDEAEPTAEWVRTQGLKAEVAAH
jgi:hypothetical protein